jgi:hypothetical protein
MARRRGAARRGPPPRERAPRFRGRRPRSTPRRRARERDAVAPDDRQREAHRRRSLYGAGDEMPSGIVGSARGADPSGAVARGAGSLSSRARCRPIAGPEPTVPRDRRGDQLGSPLVANARGMERRPGLREPGRRVAGTAVAGAALDQVFAFRVGAADEAVLTRPGSPRARAGAGTGRHVRCGASAATVARGVERCLRRRRRVRPVG